MICCGAHAHRKHQAIHRVEGVTKYGEIHVVLEHPKTLFCDLTCNVFARLVCMISTEEDKDVLPKRRPGGGILEQLGSVAKRAAEDDTTILDNAHASVLLHAQSLPMPGINFKVASHVNGEGRVVKIRCQRNVSELHEAVRGKQDLCLVVLKDSVHKCFRCARIPIAPSISH